MLESEKKEWLPQELESPFFTLQRQRDTLNRKLQEAHLKLNSAEGELDLITFYLNSILSHISQGLIFINFNGQITTCNQAAEQFLGIESDNILFQKFEKYFKDELFGFSMQMALKEKNAPQKSFATICRNGIRMEFEIETSFVLHGNLSLHHVLQGIIVLMRDITDVKRLQESVQRKDRWHVLGEMAAKVAHEIRNPLGSIKGFASLLEKDLRGQTLQHRMAKDIIQGVDHLNALVTNILRYATPYQPEFKSIDLISFVRELCRQVEVDPALHTQIRLEFHSVIHEVVLLADERLLKSALLNLIANAIQAMPNGGTICVFVSRDNQNAIIQITDSGSGIAPENLKKLFTPFFTTKEKGNGLGLAEVHKVIQIHSGTIEVDSEMDKGTTFTITLPIKG